MVAALGMLLIAGKTLKVAVVIRPINQTGSKKGTALVRFSTSFLCRIWTDLSTGAEVGRFEHFVFLFLALVCQAFCFCLWVQ